MRFRHNTNCGILKPMSIAIIETLRNTKIKYKIFFILAVLFVIILNLGILNITSVRDIEADTQNISENLIPRLTSTSTIKDNINLAILAVYEYVRTGNPANKQEYEQYMKTAVDAEVQLFQLSSSEADFEFTSSFEEHINGINDSLVSTIELYEEGGAQERINIELDEVNHERDAFAQFLFSEVETAVNEQSQQERAQTAQRVQQTIIIVTIIGCATLLVVLMMYIFASRNISSPIEELTKVAKSITTGKFKAAIIQNNDELGVFADTFNTMIQKLSAVQESLKIELARTKELDQQKSQFVATAAHELRTPISGLKWLLDMTVAGDLGTIDADVKEQLEKGVENINRMTLVINQLLAVVEIETGEMVYSLKPVSIQPLLKNVQKEFADMAAQGGVQLNIDAAHASAALVNIDTEKMQTALHALIDNAIRYTQKNGSVNVSAVEKDGDLVLTVKDTGYGIPEDEQLRVFQKLFRGSNTEAVNNLGTGLSLYIAKKIIDANQGDITFESLQDHGTTFTITFPIETAATNQ